MKGLSKTCLFRLQLLYTHRKTPDLGIGPATFLRIASVPPWYPEIEIFGRIFLSLKHFDI